MQLGMAIVGVVVGDDRWTFPFCQPMKNKKELKLSNNLFA